MRPRVAIVGATGAVGREFLGLLASRGFPLDSLRPLASARSAGSTVEFRGSPLTVEAIGPDAFDGVDLVLSSAGGSVSLATSPDAVEAGATVIDNSSAYRMDPAVPLVVPEVNGDELDAFERPGVIANPNCSTIIMLVPLQPLRERWGVRRVVVSTYQAASGAGAAAMDELESQTRDALDGKPAEPRVFSQPCAFNVFSHDSDVSLETGRNVEEQKMIDETRKIWGDPDVEVSPTCVRVPVLRAHAESIHVELAEPAREADVRAALGAQPGVRLADDRAANRFPTSLTAAGGDDVLVGRVRPAATRPDPGDPPGAHRRYELFVCGDQIRKGAALNAVQIAERLLGV